MLNAPHLMLHGIGGLAGGLLGYFFLSYCANEVQIAVGTATQCENALHGDLWAWEASTTFGAVIGIVLYHIGEWIWEQLDL